MKRLSISVLLALSLITLRAQTASFLDINPDVASSALSSSGVSAAPSAFSFFGNTASTAFSSLCGEVAASYSRWQPSGGKNNIAAISGYGRIGKRISVNAGLRYFGYPKQSVIDANASRGETFRPVELSAGAGVAVRITEWLAAGLNASYVHSDIGGPNKAGAFSVDISASADFKFLRAGLSVCNLGSPLNYGYGSNMLPMNLKIGVAAVQRKDRHKVTENLEGGFVFETMSWYCGAGAEYVYNNLVRVAAGIRLGDGPQAAPSSFSVGAGFRFAGVSLDLTYIRGLESYSVMNNTIMAGIGIAF